MINSILKLTKKNITTDCMYKQYYTQLYCIINNFFKKYFPKKNIIYAFYGLISTRIQCRILTKTHNLIQGQKCLHNFWSSHNTNLDIHVN